MLAFMCSPNVASINSARDMRNSLGEMIRDQKMHLSMEHVPMLLHEILHSLGVTPGFSLEPL